MVGHALRFGMFGLDPTTYTLAADGGGYWSGLIVPAVIVIVGLLTAAVMLLVTRDPATTVTPGTTPDTPPEGPDEDE